MSQYFFEMRRFVKILFLSLILSGCSHVFYQPDRLMYYPPELTGFSRENVYFLSHDQLRLHAWYFKSKTTPARGTIVQFHGNAQNISSHYLSLAWLTEYGYNLFVYDYRGYGESLGDPDQEKIHQDSLIALKHAWNLANPSQDPHHQWIVFGQSLGGAILLRTLADSDLKDRIHLIVLDSTFLSYKTVARQALGKFFLTWPLSPLGWLLVSDEYSPRPTLNSLKTPLLIIHDRNDPVVAYSNGEEILHSYTGTDKKEFWTLEYGTHVGTFFVDQGSLRERFVAYLKSIR